MMKEIRLIAVEGLPFVKEGDNLGTIIAEQCANQGTPLEDGDIIVVAQKIVSKSEGSVVRLDTVHPSEKAKELSGLTGRDPRLCQVYLDESSEVIAVHGRMVVTRHKLGFVCTGSGVDRSNVAPGRDEVVVLLPKDPDRSARLIRENIRQRCGKNVAVVINDSFGRTGRDGSVGIAIGLGGISHLEFRKQHDLFGNESNSRIGFPDELAAAASILMGQADESTPAVVIRGVNYTPDESASIKRMLV